MATNLFVYVYKNDLLYALLEHGGEILVLIRQVQQHGIVKELVDRDVFSHTLFIHIYKRGSRISTQVGNQNL